MGPSSSECGCARWWLSAPLENGACGGGGCAEGCFDAFDGDGGVNCAPAPLLMGNPCSLYSALLELLTESLSLFPDDPDAEEDVDKGADPRGVEAGGTSLIDRGGCG